MTVYTEYAYNGADNSIDLVLTEDGAPVDITPTTRMVAILIQGTAEVVIDSALVPAGFDWTSQGANGVLIFTPQNAALGLTGEYQLRLKVYDNSNVNGLVWIHETDSVDQVRVRVEDSEPVAA